MFSASIFTKSVASLFKFLSNFALLCEKFYIISSPTYITFLWIFFIGSAEVAAFAISSDILGADSSIF